MREVLLAQQLKNAKREIRMSEKASKTEKLKRTAWNEPNHNQSTFHF